MERKRDHGIVTGYCSVYVMEMTDEIEKQIIAFVYKRRGKEEISKADVYLTVSIQLHWCSPNMAKQFVERAIQDGLFVEKNDVLSPGFSINKVVIPVGFKPSHDFFESYKPLQVSLDVVGKEDLESYVLASVSSKEEGEKAVEQIMKEKQVVRSVALLLYAKKQDICVDDFFDDVEKELFRENRE